MGFVLNFSCQSYDVGVVICQLGDLQNWPILKKRRTLTHAISLQTSLTLTLNLSAPPKQPPPRKVKPDWWDENIQELRRTSRRLFNNARTTKLDSSWEDYKLSHQFYKKEIRSAKRRNWRNFCESIESAAEVSRLRQLLSVSPQPSCLLTKAEGSWTDWICC